eukprot:scaffold14574_cov120-Isochrysis_galbana.AAC.5
MSCRAFFGETPPSTSTQGSTPRSAHSLFNSAILRSAMSMYFGPPCPGLTSMITTTSTSSRTGSIADTGVPGLSTTPAAQPAEVIKWSTAGSCKVASG